jgi:hypothetical protein
MNDNDKEPIDWLAFEEAVRLTAYFLWEQDGRPHGRDQEYWRRALEKHRNEHRYNRWLDESPPGGD